MTLVIDHLRSLIRIVQERVLHGLVVVLQQVPGEAGERVHPPELDTMVVVRRAVFVGELNQLGHDGGAATKSYGVASKCDPELIQLGGGDREVVLLSRIVFVE